MALSYNYARSRQALILKSKAQGSLLIRAHRPHRANESRGRDPSASLGQQAVDALQRSNEAAVHRGP